MIKHLAKATLGVVALASSVASPSAWAVMVDAFDRGWYDVTGFHDPENTNYAISFNTFPPSTRNFFAFDLGGLSGQVLAASLNLTLPENGYSSGSSSETVGLFDVTVDLADLLAGTGGAGAYEDLGSGSQLGEGTILNTDAGSVVSIAFNSFGVSAINAALGGIFAVGGENLTRGTPDLLFIFTNDPAPTNQSFLSIQLGPSPAVAPEPKAAGLLLLALGALLFCRRGLRACPPVSA